MLTGSCLELLPHGRRGVRIDQTPATRARARLRGCVGARPPCAYAKQPGRRARSRAADAAAWAGAAAGHRRRAAARRHAGARCALPLALQHCVRRPAHGGCYIGGTLCWTHMRLAQSLLCLLIPPPRPQVMSNMGYFQLKASPGVWQLGVAPGRSRWGPPRRAHSSGLKVAPALRAAAPARARRMRKPLPTNPLPPRRLPHARRDLFGISPSGAAGADAAGAALADNTTTFIASFSGGCRARGVSEWESPC